MNGWVRLFYFFFWVAEDNIHILPKETVAMNSDCYCLHHCNMQIDYSIRNWLLLSSIEYSMNSTLNHGSQSQGKPKTPENIRENLKKLKMSGNLNFVRETSFIKGQRIFNVRENIWTQLILCINYLFSEHSQLPISVCVCYTHIRNFKISEKEKVYFLLKCRKFDSASIKKIIER